MKSKEQKRKEALARRQLDVQKYSEIISDEFDDDTFKAKFKAAKLDVANLKKKLSNKTK